MKLGTNDISSVYLGTNGVSKVYLGSTEVWSSFTGLLDTYTGAAAAYSLRLLRTAYTGSAIRVRRSSDNTEQDIGFSNNELDTTSLASFCSGTNGFVTTWYDQSGNGYNATQTTAANQPQIVSSGSVILENSNPTLYFDGLSGFLSLSVTMSNNFSNSTNKTIICVNKDDGITSPRNRILFIGNGGSTRVSLINESATQFDGSFNTYANRVIVTFNTQQQFLVFGQDISGTQTFYLNSTTSGTNALGGTTNDSNVSEISNDINGQYLKGNIQEMIFWSSDQSSNRTGIETNINDFYNIY